MTAVVSTAIPRVLIAEADPWTRDLLSQTLLSVRCDVQLDVCADVGEAMLYLKRLPDLIIAARELPGIDGLELLRNVRRLRPQMRLPFILMSNRTDTTSVREAVSLAPTAYLVKPLNLESLKLRLHELLLEVGQEVFCEIPALAPGLNLNRYLESRKEDADGAPLLADVQQAVKRSLSPKSLDLKQVEEELRSDPQVTAVLIAAANSAAQHRDGPVQTLMQALLRLGSTQSMNLLLGLTLKRSARLTEPMLNEQASLFWSFSLHTAEQARGLAQVLGLDEERCYSAGLLHCLGDLAVLRCMQEWKLAGGDLDEAQVLKALKEHGAGLGSELRRRWRLPLELRELIAAIYGLGGGVYSRELLAMNLAGQLARLPADQGVETLLETKAGRLLKIGMPELRRLRRNQA